MTTDHYDVIVIGGGTAGSYAAREAARKGARTAIVEEAEFGGTCLNRGCIPKKTIVSTVELLWRARRGERLGLTGTDGLGLDWAAMIDRKSRIVSEWGAGHADSFSRAGIDVLTGRAAFIDAKQLRVDGASFTADAFVVAVGSVPTRPHLAGVEHTITSSQILQLRHLPSRLTIIGGGVVALEFAFAFARAGSKVVVLEARPHVLAPLDDDIRNVLLELAAAAGIRVETNARVIAVARDKTVTAEIDGDSSIFRSDVALLAVGRTANTRTLGLDRAGVSLSDSGMCLNEYLQSSTAPHVFGAGDVAGRFQLTSVAWYEGRIAGGNAAGARERADYEIVPSAVFTIPSLAQVGLTEALAAGRGVGIETHTMDYSDNTAASVKDETEGLIKLVVGREDGRVLGAQIIGEHAEDLINIAAIAIRGRLTRSELGSTLYAYPSLAGLVFDVAAG